MTNDRPRERVSSFQAIWISGASFTIGALLGPLVLGTIKVSDRSNWAFGWNALAALGTIAAAGVAATIAVREIFLRRSEARSRAGSARVLLWPHLHLLGGAIPKIIGAPHLDIGGTVNIVVTTALQDACREVSTTATEIERLAVHLDPGHSDRVIAMLALCRYVARQGKRFAESDFQTRQMLAAFIGKSLRRDGRFAVSLVLEESRKSEIEASGLSGRPIPKWEDDDDESEGGEAGSA